MRRILAKFGAKVGLVGFTTDRSTPIGKWIITRIDGHEYYFFAFGRRNERELKPFIPLRLSAFLQLSLYRKEILSLGVRNLYLEAPELLIAVSNWDADSLCYQFPGVENPLRMARYKWGRILAKQFDRLFFRSLMKADCIMAAADRESIDKLAERSKGLIDPKKIIQFPTRFDEQIFYKQDQSQARLFLGLPQDCPVFVYAGRLGSAKGWDLVFEAFKLLASKLDDARLVFVGDGEDREKLEQRIKAHKLSNRITITGFVAPRMVAYYLNASDVFVLGSHMEGWPTAVVEALACGKPVVMTNVSGANELLKHGENGFIVYNRKPTDFAKAMQEALDLVGNGDVSLEISRKYSLATFTDDLAATWTPFE